METINTPIITTSTDIVPTSPGAIPSHDQKYVPLLSRWEKIEYCSDRYFFVSTIPGYVFSGANFDPIGKSCLPFSAGDYTYSPGVCPSGRELKKVVKILRRLTGGETVTSYQGECCESYVLFYRLSRGVALILTYFSISNLRYVDDSVTYADAWPIRTMGICLSTFGPGKEFSSYDHENNKYNSTTFSSSITAVGDIITLYWKEDNLSLFPESLAASLRIGMGLPPTPSTSSIPPSTTHSSEIPPATGVASSSDGTESAPKLSGGAIAGITVGVVVFVLVIGVLGYFAVVRRWKGSRAHPDHSTEAAASMPRESKRYSVTEWILRWRKPIPPHPGIPEMETGNNVYKYFSGGQWRSELQGSNAQSPGSGPNADSQRPRSELASVSEGSQLDHRVSRYSGLTAVNLISMELEGSVPTRQTQPPIEEAGEDVQEDRPDAAGATREERP